MLEKQKEHLKDIRSTKISKLEAFIGEALFIIFFVLYNLFEIYLIYLIAKYNDRVIELGTILLCFAMNKSLFGKPLHFISSLICFIVSLSTFYVVIRCSVSSGLSLFANVLLGVGTGATSSYIATYIIKPKHKRNLLKEIAKHKFTTEQILEICRLNGLDEEIGYIVNFRLTSNEDLTCYEFSIDRSTLNRKLNIFIKAIE